MPTPLAHLLTIVLAATPAVLVPPSPKAPDALHPRVAGPTQPVSAPRGGVWPLAPAPDVVRGFDPPVSTYGAGHRGVDLLGSPGQPVRAAVPGRVRYVGSLAGRGVVVIEHGATRTTYEPVDAVVALGSLVEKGQRVGTLQSSASHCAPAACLHWGLLEGDTYLDPLSLVRTPPVRLLPLTGLEQQ